MPVNACVKTQLQTSLFQFNKGPRCCVKDTTGWINCITWCVLFYSVLATLIYSFSLFVATVLYRKWTRCNGAWCRGRRFQVPSRVRPCRYPQLPLLHASGTKGSGKWAINNLCFPQQADIACLAAGVAKRFSISLSLSSGLIQFEGIFGALSRKWCTLSNPHPSFTYCGFRIFWGPRSAQRWCPRAL